MQQTTASFRVFFCQLPVADPDCAMRMRRVARNYSFRLSVNRSTRPASQRVDRNLIITCRSESAWRRGQADRDLGPTVNGPSSPGRTEPAGLSRPVAYSEAQEKALRLISDFVNYLEYNILGC